MNFSTSVDYKAISPYLLAPIAQALLDNSNLKDTDFEAILNDPDHTFYGEATRLYGLIQLGQVVQAAGGDVSYWIAGTRGRRVSQTLHTLYRSTNEAIEEVNLGQLFTEWAVAYQDEGGLYVR